ncbi:MAG: hypothetical protein MMC23_009810 [Stictis urceolatum]|nr:hypothetical protein [Stictis urceolata]
MLFPLALALACLSPVSGNKASSALASAPAGLDPIENYCQRFDHQSILKDDILYVDGGTQTFVGKNEGGWADGDITIGNNNYLITVNMTRSWDWKRPHNITETFINKTANPNTGTWPPQVVRGSLFSGTAADSKIYLYGGTTSFRNVSFPGFQSPMPDQYTLWSYDTNTSNWDQYDVRDDAPLRVNSGASAEAPDLGLAFVFIDNGSASGTSYLRDVKQFLGGMIAIDTKTQAAKNISTAEATGNEPLSRSKITYVSGIGEKGILVLIGGSSKKIDEFDSSDIGQLARMDTVTVFDIASIDSGKPAWYRQKTSGDVPSGRVDHCLVSTSAPDNSSYQITMYGGRAGDAALVDDVWTLSIPAFRWTKFFSGSSPRFGHTCHVVGKRQMLSESICIVFLLVVTPIYAYGGSSHWRIYSARV